MDKFTTKTVVTTKERCLMDKNMGKMEFLYLPTAINFKVNSLMIISKMEYTLPQEAYNIKALLKEIKKTEKVL
jgi:hypothetical protein